MIKNKYLIAAYIDENQANITAKCNEGMPVKDIAKLYGVTASVIYLRLIKWGVKITCKNRGTSRRKNEIPGKHYKRQFSQAFLAKQKENTKINNEQIEYIKSKYSTAGQKLVDNLLSRPIIG